MLVDCDKKSKKGNKSIYGTIGGKEATRRSVTGIGKGLEH
jgi:hypothetical protein